MDGLGPEKKPLVSPGQIYALLGVNKAAIINPGLQEEEAMPAAQSEEPQRTMHRGLELQQPVRPGSRNAQGEQNGQRELRDCMEGLCVREELRDRTQRLHPEEFGHRSQARVRLTDTRYPQTLPTEESPRRRARSLPETSIPEAGEEEDEASLVCCCKLKKRVQFADSLGLTLASVKHFLSSDEPMVPPAVLARLQSYPPSACEQEEDPASSLPLPEELPGRLGAQRLCLEQVSASIWGVRGSVLVQDPEDGGRVKIRYTFNEWLSYLDCPASAPAGPLPAMQRFLFTLCYPPTTARIHFAICYTDGHGQETWDNNQGSNYTVTCQRELAPGIQNCDTELDAWESTQHW
ncbi:protein phosphatase 1 regulatory subunit 3G [Spea bombifrons]|uniref:protein phosphatase 1 regulatory subunit 3G n=1 Tax=Spea bombifrons TaxID=233779 RepID=UPI00234A3F29|nr:protein phosphatase 1 regulatory subunit 3G [Spea bombifrons]